MKKNRTLGLMKRYLEAAIKPDLKNKMVFVGGPRQVGKTTLAKNTLPKASYYNWDIPVQRRAILRRELRDTKSLIFDEIHKYKSWRNYLKGLYDEFGRSKEILVTGSAKLDLLRRGGDSLQGRYHYYRLHPFSYAELGKSIEDLFTLGGFPEPFLSGSKRQADRWTREYSHRFFRDELLSVQHIQDVGNLELLYERLPELVANPLSLNALREDLQVAHHTVSRWLDLLELFYGIFRLSPFGAPLIRAVKKEQKHYHFDWNLVSDEGARFENMIACHLLKWAHYLEDTEGRAIELRYFRDVDLREVDFVLTEQKKPILFVECKVDDAPITKGLMYLKERFKPVASYQISLRGKKDYVSPQGIRVCRAVDLLKNWI